MDVLGRLSAFYEKACADSRLSPTHLSLYLALLHELYNKTNQQSLVLNRVLIMDKAKISSRVTYHKCMRELHQYGYINYTPNNMPGGSEVRMIELE